MNTTEGNLEAEAGIAAFQQALQQLGWSEGRNVRFDIRWGRNDVERDRRYAAELVALAPAPKKVRFKGTCEVGFWQLSGVKQP